MRNQITVRAIIVYVLAVIVGWLLTGVVWGAAGGVIGGLSMSRHPEYSQKVDAFLKARGIDTHDRVAMRTALSRLPPADVKAMQEMTRTTLLRDVNWFAVTVFVSAVVFGLVGFLGGLISRTWVLAVLLPAIPFTVNPIMRFEMAKDLTTLQKVIVMTVQFAGCWIVAFLGAKVAMRNQGAANKTPEHPFDQAMTLPG
jgi:hypothetical protein